jgi:uncharacterized protein involved in exopolysaccharide biosynthesis
VIPVSADPKELSAYPFQNLNMAFREGKGPPNSRFADDYGSEQIDLRHYWELIRKRIWLVLSVPLACVAVMGIRDLMATRLYTARSTILIKSNAPPVY